MAIHPLARLLGMGIQYLYPLNEGVAEQLMQFQGMINALPVWQVVLVIALMPAIFEELAFRGFMLSGFYANHRNKWRAIILSAVFFGFTHTILQQSISAAIVGVVIAYIVIQADSIWAGMLFHFTHNGLNVFLDRLNTLGTAAESGIQTTSPDAGQLMPLAELFHKWEPMIHGWQGVTIASVLTVMILAVYWRFGKKYPVE